MGIEMCFLHNYVRRSVNWLGSVYLTSNILIALIALHNFLSIYHLPFIQFFRPLKTLLSLPNSLCHGVHCAIKNQIININQCWWSFFFCFLWVEHKKRSKNVFNELFELKTSIFNLFGYEWNKNNLRLIFLDHLEKQEPRTTKIHQKW